MKLLTHPETGAIAAVPTTLLPEVIGGVRNWDYRFAWIRDASFTVQSLYNLGHVEEAQHYFRWLRGLCRQFGEHEDHLHIQVMYGLHGEQDLEERELHHLSGYRNSAPVRIGNAAAEQVQLDVYGELVNAFYETRRYGEETGSSFARSPILHVRRGTQKTRAFGKCEVVPGTSRTRSSCAGWRWTAA
ncbi:MAG: hypothetical protein GTN93_12130 [Anaerolineae bacterium]|nr:hypothetical protein [Anaerolineae bacterium]NIQ78813.1 hypothetical protein [Anaerolineae bacterium]